MNDDQKTKPQLLLELAELRSQKAELRQLAADRMSAELAAEEICRYSERIVDAIREPLLVLNAELKIIVANRSFYRTFRVTPSETIGCYIYDLGNRQWNVPALRELLEEILPKNESFDDFMIDHVFPAIGHKIMLLNARRVSRKDLKSEQILLAIEDITERKHLEDLCAESEERYRRLFETADDGIVLLEKGEGKITHFNPAAEKMLGYSQKESVGHKLKDIGVTEVDDIQMILYALNNQGIVNYDDVLVHPKSGQTILTDIYFVDRARLLQCNIRDVSERKRAEEMIIRSEKKYHELFDFLPIPVYEMDLEGRLLIANNAFYAAFRGTEEDLKKGICVWTYLSPKDVDKSKKYIERMLKGLNPVGTEYTLTRMDGSTFPAIVFARLIHNQGEAAGFLGAIVDISKHRQMGEELRQTNDFLHSIIENIPDMIFLKDAKDLKFVKFNRAGEELLGQTKDDLIGKNDYDLFPKEQADFFTEKDREVLSGKKKVDIPEEHIQTRRGEIILHTKKIPLLNESGESSFLLGISEDITERKKAEDVLQETLRRLKNAVETTIQVMISAVETRDPYTSGHQKRMTELASAIAVEMGLPIDNIEAIRMAGPIHDIGKLSIPAEILSKPTKLTEIEFAMIQEHSQAGFEILKNVQSPWPLAEIVYQHHERTDGSGYPRHLKRDEILMEARVLAVADVVESMISHRPYRPALGIVAAMKEIETSRGILFDADVVDACLRLFREQRFNFEIRPLGDVPTASR